MGKEAERTTLEALMILEGEKDNHLRMVREFDANERALLRGSNANIDGLRVAIISGGKVELVQYEASPEQPGIMTLRQVLTPRQATGLAGWIRKHIGFNGQEAEPNGGPS